jgi:hypothetical protein
MEEMQHNGENKCIQNVIWGIWRVERVEVLVVLCLDIQNPEFDPITNFFDILSSSLLTDHRTIWSYTVQYDIVVKLTKNNQIHVRVYINKNFFVSDNYKSYFIYH